MKQSRNNAGWVNGFLQNIILGICIITMVLGSVAQAEQGFGSGSTEPSSLINVTILAINDFHGQIPAGITVNGSPVGNAGVMAAYLTQAIHATGGNHTILALPGDFTGASPPESGLLLDEPTLLFYNLFAGNTSKEHRYTPIASCPVIATVGNHEFDKNITELYRKISGGNGSTTIPHLQDPYPGFSGSVIAANVVWKEDGKMILPPALIRDVDGVPVAFIGAVTNTTPYLVKAENVKDLVFLNEVDSINAQIRDLQTKGVHAFVILLHEGGSQPPYDGATRQDVQVTGPVTDIVSQLDGDVDVVLSGHTHEFTNAFMQNSKGNDVLVTQAYAYSKGFANVSIALDPKTRDISWKSATIVVPYADRPPGTNPDPQASLLLNDTLNATGPILNDVISRTDMDINTSRNADGESAIYDLVVDSMRTAMQTDMAVLNEGAVRANISPGNITIGKMYQMLPFSNNIVTVNMTGAQIRSLLEQQWTRTIRPDHLLQISGVRYTYDATRSPGDRILSIAMNQSPIELKKEYSVATIAFLTGGGDGYTVMKDAKTGITGPFDVDVLMAYVKNLSTPLVILPDGRISQISPGNVTVTGITPDTGGIGESIPATITGGNFTSQAIVSLKSRDEKIPGENTSVLHQGEIHTIFTIPESFEPGKYNITVTNPDGSEGFLSGAFHIHPRSPPSIIRVNPGTVRSGTPVSLVVQGSDFLQGAEIFADQDNIRITGKYPIWASNRTISASFSIPAGHPGDWNLSVANPDEKSGELIKAFRVIDE